MLNRLLLLICLVSLTAKVHAGPIDFYSATVTVASQTASERSRAAQEGFKQVLIRVSGSTDVVLAPSIIAEMSKANAYLDQYSYQTHRLENGDKEEQLQMGFSSAQVRRILADAALPVWPTNRPNVLLWLVSDQQDVGKQFVSSFDSPVAQGLEQSSLARGLPITFPLMDLDDQLALSAQQVWSLNEDAILQASERYGADTILVGRYTQTTQGQWWGTWQFFHRGQNRVFDLRTDDGQALGRQGLQPLADYLAHLYSVSTSALGSSQLYMQINMVDGFKSYKGVLGYMDKLAVVASYRIVSIQNSEMLLGLRLAGNQSQLSNAIALDNKIQSEAIQTASGSPGRGVPEGTLERPLKYRWIGK